MEVTNYKLMRQYAKLAKENLYAPNVRERAKVLLGDDYASELAKHFGLTTAIPIYQALNDLKPARLWSIHLHLLSLESSESNLNDTSSENLGISEETTQPVSNNY